MAQPEPHVAIEPVAAPHDRVAIGTLLSYAPPVVALSSPLFMVQFYFLNFATDVLLLAPLGVGLLFAAGRAWDAISDPIVGTWSDRTSTRLGRRRPWMLASIPLLMLNQGKSAANRVAKQFGIERCKVLAKEYKFLHIDSHSVCFGAVIVANKSMPDKTAYDVTKAMLSQIEAFKTGHRALKVTTPKSIAQPGAAPHHPGAIKAYKEAGLM